MQGMAPGFPLRCRNWFMTACLMSTLLVQPALAWQFREVVTTTKSAEKSDRPSATAESPKTPVASEPTLAPPHQAPLDEPKPDSTGGTKGTPGTVVISDTYTKEVLEVPEDPESIEPLRFRGVQPGETKITELPDDWGEPFKISNGKEQDSPSIYKYRLKPFRQVDVTTDGETVTMLLIHLSESQDPAHLASELYLSHLDPVPVPDQFGEVLGIAFPERGVLMTFDSEVEDGLVKKIQLEPITPEPFLLRAEYDFQGRFSRDLEDLQTALELNPKYAHAHWLKAMVLKETGRMHDALASASDAARYHPRSALYHLAKAELVGLNGDYDTALRETRRILDRADLSSLERARGVCQLGTLLARGPEGQYKEAMRHHQKAIELAAPLANERQFKPRRLAKRILIDAHLAMAKNVAHGDYQQQKVTVRKWVDSSMALVDETVRRDQGDESLRLDVYLAALRVHGDLGHTGNPEVLTERALRDARRMIAESTDDLNKSRLEWKLATILAEAVRVQRLRGNHEAALRRADEAMVLFKQSAITRQSTPDQRYLVGILYFRVGSLHAVQREDHREAIQWYERAQSMLNGQLPVSIQAESDIHGERFVSMGVSYWEEGQRETGIELTERGVEIIQAAVDNGVIGDNVLAVPYTNLATMHAKEGNADDSKAFAKLAAKVGQGSQLR